MGEQSRKKNIGAGVFGMIGGYGNGDGEVNDTDKSSIWTILTGGSGYLNGDYNLNGQINNSDKNDIWQLNTGQSTQAL